MTDIITESILLLSEDNGATPPNKLTTTKGWAKKKAGLNFEDGDEVAVRSNKFQNKIYLHFQREEYS